MKRFLPIFAACALFLPALQPARGADISLNLFYDNLSGGNWYEVADSGYVWQPDVASNSNWRPYTDGYWAYTDQGWTWVSYEDFGWATYHYGRWARLADYGWVWVPGTEWAPAWVSWRTGGDYVGWAPLPPAGGGEVVYESRPITGHVDVEFGIGPAYYNFIDVRYIGEPVLRDRIVDYNRNVTIINNTVNVTNITSNNSTVYNYGPDYATVSAYSVRPIQRLKLQRENLDAMQAVRSGNMTKVQGNQLLVAAPMRLQKGNAQVAPKQVKAKIEQPKVEKGWSDVSDPNEKAKLEQKFKAENAKNVPKPTFQPMRANTAVGPNANERAGAGANAAASPAERVGRGKGKNKAETAASAAPPAVVASPNPVEQGRGAKNKNRPERTQASPAAAGQNQSDNARAEEPNRNREATRPGQNVAPAGKSAINAERPELKTKPESAQGNGTKARENERRAPHNQAQREAQEQQRQQQERPQQQTQNGQPPNHPERGNHPQAPNRPQNAAPPAAVRSGEQAARRPHAQPEGAVKEKAKPKKPEGQQTPPPQ
jgi:hypothetical protein